MIPPFPKTGKGDVYLAFFRASCYRPFSGKEPTICDAVKIILDILGFGAIILTFRVTQRICVTVAHRTLTPFAGVRIPHPLPTKKTTQRVVFFVGRDWDSNPFPSGCPVDTLRFVRGKPAIESRIRETTQWGSGYEN